MHDTHEPHGGATTLAEISHQHPELLQQDVLMLWWIRNGKPEEYRKLCSPSRATYFRSLARLRMKGLV